MGTHTVACGAEGGVGGIEAGGEDGMNTTLILAMVLVAQSALVSVSELVADPDRFNGQPVIVSGTISSYREGATLRGSRYYTFDLGDGTHTVVVIALGEPPCRSGAATVEGTFERWSVKSSSLDEITARNVICLPEEAVERAAWEALRRGSVGS